jgi:hypothetical protein
MHKSDYEGEPFLIGLAKPSSNSKWRFPGLGSNLLKSVEQGSTLSETPANNRNDGNWLRTSVANMSHHDYRDEPNVRVPPDKTMVFFTSNLFGASYVFGVE